MNRSKAPRMPRPKAALTISADHLVTFKDPPGGLPIPPERNGKLKAKSAHKQQTKQDRLRPLVSQITHCLTLARHIDPKGLDDVVESLQKAYSKALDHQFDR